MMMDDGLWDDETVIEVRGHIKEGLLELISALCKFEEHYDQPIEVVVERESTRHATIRINRPLTIPHWMMRQYEEKEKAKEARRRK